MDRIQTGNVGVGQGPSDDINDFFTCKVGTYRKRWNNDGAVWAIPYGALSPTLVHPPDVVVAGEFSGLVGLAGHGALEVGVGDTSREVSGDRLGIGGCPQQAGVANEDAFIGRYGHRHRRTGENDAGSLGKERG